MSWPIAVFILFPGRFSGNRNILLASPLSRRILEFQRPALTRGWPIRWLQTQRRRQNRNLSDLQSRGP